MWVYAFSLWESIKSHCSVIQGPLIFVCLSLLCCVLYLPDQHVPRLPEQYGQVATEQVHQSVLLVLNSKWIPISNHHLKTDAINIYVNDPLLNNLHAKKPQVLCPLPFWSKLRSKFFQRSPQNGKSTQNESLSTCKTEIKSLTIWQGAIYPNKMDLCVNWPCIVHNLLPVLQFFLSSNLYFPM